MLTSFCFAGSGLVFPVCWVVLGSLENRAFKGLLWVAYALVLVAYITCLLGRFGAFWRHCGGGGLGGSVSREFFTVWRRARMRDARVRVRVCAHVRVCARMHVCACTYNPPPRKMRPPYF